MNPGLILACVVAEADLVVARQLLSQPPSTKAASYTVISATSAIGVVNVSIREPRNLKREKLRELQKEKHFRIGFLFLKILHLAIICSSLTTL